MLMHTYYVIVALILAFTSHGQDGVVNRTNAILMTIDTTQNLLNTASSQVVR